MDLASYDGSLYFGADGSDFAGQELWKYDGINFSRAADIYSGSSNSDPRYMTVFEGELYLLPRMAEMALAENFGSMTVPAPAGRLTSILEVINHIPVA